MENARRKCGARGEREIGVPRPSKRTWWWAALVLAVGLLVLGARVAMALNFAGIIDVSATMGQLSPNPIRVGDTATASLSASYSQPGNVPEGTYPTPQYKPLYADSYGAPPSNSYTLSISPSQPSSTGGAQVSFTPLIAGYWQLTGICDVTLTDQAGNDYWTGSANTSPVDMASYLLQIDYEGVDVDNQTQDVSVGQDIPLVAEYGPADMSLKWTVAGTSVVAGYQANSTSAVVTPLASTDLQKPSLSFYWVYTGNGSTQDENVALAGTLPNTAYQNVKTTFNVFEPTASINGSVEGSTLADDNYIIDLQENPPSTHTWLHFGGSYNPARDTAGTYTPGIEFDASWTLPPAQFGDDFTCVQVITENESDWWNNATGKSITARTNFGEDYVDTTYPYGWEFQSPTSASTSDSPGVDLTGWNNADDQQDSDMYLMFTPGGTNSIPVPVGEVEWSWAGVWPPAGGNAPAPQVLTPSQEPQWEANITSVVPVQVQQDRVLGPIPTPPSADGLSVRLAPGASGLTVRLSIKNANKLPAIFSGGVSKGWILQVFEVSKKRVTKAPRTHLGTIMDQESRGGWNGRSVVVPPASERACVLQLAKYFVLRSPGVYLVRAATEWGRLEGSHGNDIRLGTNLLELSLDRAGQIKWKNRHVRWPTLEPPTGVPPAPMLPINKIPHHGPLGALPLLVAAIKRGDPRAVRHLVAIPPGGSLDYACVRAELAYSRLDIALSKRFGPSAAATLKPVHGLVSPTATETLSQRVDIKTLEIGGDYAEVSAWMFDYGPPWKWIPGPGFRFQRVKGRWRVLEGRHAPPHSMLKIWQDFAIKQAQAYDSLGAQVVEGKFSSMANFENAYKSRTAALIAANRADERAFIRRWRPSSPSVSARARPSGG